MPEPLAEVKTQTLSTTKIFQNPTTIDKHGSQLGRYRLIRVQGGRPIYQHVDTEAQFLYYHPYSGGNWLINSEVGLLYGGIQNSKDSPLCPYLINTVSLSLF